MTAIKVWVSVSEVDSPVSSKKGSKKVKKSVDAHVERILTLEELGLTLQDWEESGDKWDSVLLSIPGVKPEWGVSLVNQ